MTDKEKSTCYEVLQETGYNLSKYNKDIKYHLQTAHGNIEVCELFLTLLLKQYGDSV